MFLLSLRKTRTKIVFLLILILVLYFFTSMGNQSNMLHKNTWWLGGLSRNDTNNLTLTSLKVPGINCKALFEGDDHEIFRTKEMLFKEAWTPLQDAYFTEATESCSQFKEKFGYLDRTFTDEEREFPIAYSIVVHRNAEQTERLLRAIYTPFNTYCIHVDKKSSEDYQDAMQYIAKCFPNVFVSSRNEKVIYAGYSRLRADLNCLRDLLNHDDSWKYVINLCGQDYPLKSNKEIVRHLKGLQNMNDIPGVLPLEQHLVDRFKYIHKLQQIGDSTQFVKTSMLKGLPPYGVQSIYFGSAYFVATREFAQYALTDQLSKQLLVWFNDTYSPDENYWATLNKLRGVPSGNSMPGWSSIVRAIKWRHLAPKLYPECQGYYLRSICVYGVGDLQWLSQQVHLFANKFDLGSDHIAFKCLDERLEENQKTDMTNFTDVPLVFGQIRDSIKIAK